MANVKKILHPWSATGLTVYSIIRREADGYLLNDADGAFANAPADPYISLTENGTIKGLYEKSESRTAWNDGLYVIAIYKQIGGSPAPVSDTLIGGGELQILTDAEVVQTGDTYPIVSSASKGIVKIYDDMATKVTADLIEDILRNKLVINELNGAATLYADNNSTPLLTNSIISLANVTTRTRLE